MRIATKMACSDEALPYVLEGLCEGLVLASIEQIERSPNKDQFPCCCQCGGFRLRGPKSARFVDWEGPEELLSKGSGNALSLCVYQAAQARREGKSAQVICDLAGPDTITPIVSVDGEYVDVSSKLAPDSPALAGDMSVERNGCGCGRDEP